MPVRRRAVVALCSIVAAFTLAGCRHASPPATPKASTSHAAAPGAEPHWSYEGSSGPAGWPSLSPSYAACGIGREQSPIER
jgi:carbonic anhydrase